MKWPVSELTGYSIAAADGTIGSVADLLFDDRDWTIRWLVVDTGTWLPGRQVLLPPRAVDTPDRSLKAIATPLTRGQVEESPALDTDAPVSRQAETDLYRYYGSTLQVPGTWYGGVLAAGVAAPLAAASVAMHPEPPLRERDHGDPHLRSCRHITGFGIAATDGTIGHVEDFVVDDQGWAITRIVVDTVNWWPGPKVTIAPAHIANINWSEQRVSVDLTRAALKQSPAYAPAARDPTS